MKFTFIAYTLFFALLSLAQRGKDGDYTVSSSGEILNTYTYLTADASSGSTTISVNSATLNNAFFGSNLQTGDLIFIHQLQGASMKIETFPVTSWGGDWTGPLDTTWGAIQAPDYFNSGLYEFAEVASVSGSTITLNCGLKHNYTRTGHVSVTRVPRINNLTVPNGTSITAADWNGNSGGSVILEVDSTLDIQAGGVIEADFKGFRGGLFENNTAGGGVGYYGVGSYGTFTTNRAGRKGEGAGGYITEYSAYYSEYAKGAPGNGGGGGNGHNSGGGGGANAGLGLYYSGKGVPNPTYSTNWNLEYPGFSGNPSIGGGRGGYSSSGSGQNPATTAPGNTAWGSDNRRIEGGFGGHTLDYSSGRAWFGGGGGAGDGNDGEGGDGGNGGGMVYIMAYGNFTGSGLVSANGEDGEDSQGPPPGFSSISGDDGAGGAGAGGVVLINSIANVPNTLTISVDGGIGGDNHILFGSGAGGNNFGAGPGGGGGGGYVATSAGSPTISASGGANGITTAKPFDTEFPPNGATSGNIGITGGSLTPFEILIADDTICGGGNVTLTATILGSLPTGATQLTWWDAQYGGTVLGNGNSLTLNGLVSNTTVYVGTCPGTFRKEVNILVSPPIVISGTATVNNTACNGTSGSITGLSATGGSGVLVYDWNGTVTAGTDLLNASPGSYTLTVTDDNGCTANSGPYTISSISGPAIDSLNYVLTPESCASGDGSITGITATGSMPLIYTWNTTVYPGSDINDATSGVYWLYVEDVNGCVDSTGPYNMTQVAGPVIDSLNYSITNSACTGNTGTVTGITATGVATLSYAWNGVATAGPDLSNAAVGSYTLVVTDGNGCKDSTGVYFVGQQNPPVIDSINYVLDPTSCDANDGGISGITVTGNSPFTFEWNGNPNPSADITGLGIGNYMLVVTDINGCKDSTGIYVIDTEALPVIDSLNYSIVNTSCDTDDGQISGITVSGASPFVFEWNGVPSGNTDATGLGVGSYTLVVTDDNGCVDSTGVYMIGQQNPPVIDSLSYTITERSCISDDATISGISVSGNSPFQYFWNGVSSATADASNLGLGNFTLVVVDANGCSDSTGVYSVTQAPDPQLDSSNIVITPSDCGASTGAVAGITSTGTAPFQYFWDGVAGNANQTGLAPGLHVVVVVDANGCDDTLTGINVGTLNGPIIDASGLSTEDDHCSQGSGSISGITVSAGTPGYTYLWTGGGTSLDVSGLDSGSYQLTVTDAAGCTAFYGPISISNVPGPTIIETSLAITDDFCNLGNGIITGLTANGASPFTYSWSNGANTLALLGVNSGVYTLTVTDAFGCSAISSNITVGNSNPNPIDFTWTPNPVTVTNPNVTFTGNVVDPYLSSSWDFNSFGTDTGMVVSTVMDVIGNYTVTLVVEFSPGCSDTVSHIVTVTGDLIIPNVITPNGDGMNENFTIEGLLPNTKVTILNRWGNLIYESDNYDNQWDGTDMGGLKVSDGEYFYVIITPQDETYQGNVRILTK
ncbi:MAG: gliding motility-associated C-terminal domain-containing protein [Crocinitomicaceae bacterium]